VCSVGCPSGFTCNKGICTGGDLQNLKLNVKTVAVSGVVTLNGKAPTFGPYCKTTSSTRFLWVRFQELQKGYTIEVKKRCNEKPHDFSFALDVFPGTYKVSVGGYTSGYSNLPTTLQVIHESLKLDAPKSGLVLDVKTVPVSGVVTMNGKAPTFGPYCKSTSSTRFLRVTFREQKKGYTITMLKRCSDKPHDFSFEGQVFPGTYKVSVSGYTTGYSNLPTTPQVIYDALSLTAPKSGLVLDMKTVPVSGVVTMNGNAPTFGPYCKSTSSTRFLRVTFAEMKKGYTITLLKRCSDKPHDFSFEGLVYPGTYKVSASGYTSGYSNLPTTAQVIYDSLAITAPRSGLVLDVKTVPVSGVVTLNGKAPTFGPYCKSTSSTRFLRVTFQELKKGYYIDLLKRCSDKPHDFSFEGQVFPGTYRVSAAGYTSGYSSLPTTRQVIYDSLTITAPKSGLVLDVKTVPVSGMVTLNGKTPTFGPYCKTTSSTRFLRVRFQEMKKGYSIEFRKRCSDKPHDFSFEGQLFPGTYKVYAGGYTAGYSSLPTTGQVIYDALTITAPKSGLVLDVKTVTVAGVVLLNGKPPTFGPYCKTTSSTKFLRVRFYDATKGYSLTFDKRCSDSPHDHTFKTEVFPGTYKVYAGGYTTGYSSLPTTAQVVIDRLAVQ